MIARTDLAITGRPPESADIVAHHFMDNPLVVIAEPRHTLAERNQIPMHLLGDEAMIAREHGSGTHAAAQPGQFLMRVNDRSDLG
jgi:DNA-binding transcriptional LysR family regulator